MTQRKVEVFSAGCGCCDEAVKLVQQTCTACDVTILDMSDPAVAQRAKDLGVKAVPAVAVDGALLDCCKGGIDADALRDAGICAP